MHRVSRMDRTMNKAVIKYYKSTISFIFCSLSSRILLSTKVGRTKPRIKTTVMEPNVDFDFHVKISVNSGKCVLHTAKDEEKRRMKKDRSFSGNIFDNSPNVSRKFRSGGGPPGTGDNRERSSTRLRAPTAQDMTIFYIPGHYFAVKDIVKQ